MPIKQRNADRDDNGYKNRRWFDLKLFFQLLTFLIGGSVAGVGITFTSPTAPNLQLRIEKQEMKFDEYITKSKEFETLKKELMNEKYKNLEDRLARIEKKLDRILNGNN